MKCSNHTPLPVGYAARQEAFIDLMRDHKQIVCPQCGRWAIWLEVVECGRSLREENHRPHQWRFQFSDDSPAMMDAWCKGYQS